MCSCIRDKKPHTEACRASKRRYDRGPKSTATKARYILRRLGAYK